MYWIIITVTAKTLGIMILVFVYFFVYTKDRQRYVGIWALSWFFYSLQLCIGIWMISDKHENPVYYLILTQVMALVSGMVFLWGTYVFLERKFSGKWVYGSILIAVWIIRASFVNYPFSLIILPVYIFLAAVYVLTGVYFLRSPKIKGIGRPITGWALILWGVHKANYPLLHPLAWTTPWWDYLLTSILTFIVALSILFVYAQNIRTALKKEQDFSTAVLNTVGTMIENINQAVFVIDQCFIFTYISPAIVKILHYQPEKIIGISFFELVHEIDREKARYCIEQSMKGCLETFELRVRNANGCFRFVMISGQPLKKGSRLTELNGVISDITEQKQMEQALRESEKLYRMLAENVSDVIWIIDFNLQFNYLSPSAQRSLGYSVEEIKEMELEEYILPSSMHVIFKTLQEEFAKDKYDESDPFREFAMVLELMCKNKSIAWAEVRTTFLHDSAGQSYAFLGVARNINERKRAEDREAVYRERLQSLAVTLSLTEERERRRIATEIHDYIGQSLALTSIKLGLLKNLVEKKNIGLVEEIRYLVEESIRYTRSLTFDLSPPVLYELGFIAAVEWLCEQVQSRHRLLVRLEKDGIPENPDNETQVILFQAIRELLFNIVKHAQAQKVWINIKSDTENQISVSIEDDGVGFNPLNKGLRRSEGFGHFSIRERVKYLGGKFEIESRPGKGTRVLLEAPLNKVSIINLNQN
ncbi:PAS domain S-box protein [Desulfoscipio sp. XC116]|uniref:PAS domain S-box protein n=1 Tax=Desulfoscipio sp. XC116 TaxID=3144975 RepID=UPI00325BB238